MFENVPLWSELTNAFTKKSADDKGITHGSAL